LDFTIFILTNPQNLDQPFFNSKPLSTWSWASLIVYISLGIYLYCNYTQALEFILFLYACVPLLMLYFIGYRALRNIFYFLCWLVIAVIHLYIYCKVKDNPLFAPNKFRDINIVIGFRNTIISLLILQVLRYASLKIQGQELVSVSKGGTTDLFDGRKITLTDKTLFLVYAVVLILMFIY
jgi:hypothetical protein